MDSLRKVNKQLKAEKQLFMDSPEGIAYKKRLYKESNYQKEYREKNKEKKKYYNKQYREKSKEKIKEYIEKYLKVIIVPMGN